MSPRFKLSRSNRCLDLVKRPLWLRLATTQVLSRFHLDQLDQVATGFIENSHVNCTGIHRFGNEVHAALAQFLPFCIEVLHLK